MDAGVAYCNGAGFFGVNDLGRRLLGEAVIIPTCTDSVVAVIGVCGFQSSSKPAIFNLGPSVGGADDF